MAIQKNLINNFLLTSTKDFSIKLLDRENNVISLFDLVNNDDFKSFLTNPNKNSIYFHFPSDRTISDDSSNSKISTKFSFAKKIKRIIKISDEKYKEDGVWFLHLCCYFLKGKISDDKYIKAPLILFPIKIQHQDSGFLIEKRSGPIFNEKLNFFLDIKTGSNIVDSFEEIMSGKDEVDFARLVTNYSNNFTHYNLKIDPNHNFTNFVFNDVDKANDFKILEIDYSICITLLDPTGGKIKKDILEITKMEINPFHRDSFIKNNEEIKNTAINSDTLIELDGSLNIDQKYSVVSSLTENTIIYGPPGTGKSEVIANIIANIVWKGKTSLVVSEKKTALDVIEDRIKNLKHISLSSFDNNYYQDFFLKINNFSNLVLNLKNNLTLKDWSESYLKLIDNFDNLKILDDEKFLNLDKEYIYDKLFLGNNVYSDKNAIIFNYLYDIATAPNYDIDKAYNLFLIIKEFVDSNKDTIEYLKEKNGSIDNKEIIEKFLNKFSSSKDKEYLLSNYLDKNKIKNKILFSKVLKRINYDTGKIIIFLEKLKDLNLENINFPLLYLFSKETFSFAEIEKGILQRYFLILLETKTNNLLQADFKNYLKTKEQISSNVSETLLNIYVARFKNLYEKMTIVEKAKIDEVFAIAKLEKKVNIISFSKKYYQQLRIIFPIWILNNLQSSIITPNVQSIFDYGIFDEASQIFLERAFPTIFRSNIAIISGDDKQLKPSSFFISRTEFEDDDFDNAESLLDKAKSCMWSSFHLKKHYRSNSSELIEFSNKHFYDDQLEFATKNNNFKNAIEVIDVKGIWDDNMNAHEANIIIEQIMLNVNLYNTIMVIAFNEKQTEYIENLFLERHYATNKILDKYNNGSIIFKNLENAQGNEADLVILSLSYGFNPEGKLNHFFGPLSFNGGGNRLNVAITRAKSKMIVVKSIKAIDMKINSLNDNSQIFYKYISFLDAFSSKPPVLHSEQFASHCGFRNKIYGIVTKILNPNLKVLTNINLGSIKIDFAICDINNSKIYSVININRVFDKDSFTNTIENLYKQEFLTSRGYVSINIDSVEWYNKPKLSEFNLFKMLEEINLNVNSNEDVKNVNE
ncbi:MAG: AAA domain-containing protein [Malacoplasma sp.]